MKKKVLGLIISIILIFITTLIVTVNVNADSPYAYNFADLSYDQVKNIRIW